MIGDRPPFNNVRSRGGLENSSAA